MKEAFRLVKIDVPIPAKIDWTAWLKDGNGEVALERRLLAHQVLRALREAGEDERARELLGGTAGRGQREAAGPRVGSGSRCG